MAPADVVKKYHDIWSRFFSHFNIRKLHRLTKSGSDHQQFRLLTQDHLLSITPGRGYALWCIALRLPEPMPGADIAKGKQGDDFMTRSQGIVSKNH